MRRLSVASVCRLRFQPCRSRASGWIPLAAKCIEAGAAVLRHTGERFTQANIGQQLAMRDLMADLRAANPLNQGGGGKGFTKADRSRFLNALETELRQAKGRGNGN